LKKKYKHLFFDLDHTLWDYEKNTEEAVREIYDLFNLSKWSFTLEEFTRYFHETNNFLWDRFNHCLIGREELRNDRFKIILGNLGLKAEDVPEEIADAYLNVAPSKSSVMPYTYEVLDYLAPKYKLHIISNGFDDVQHRKLKAANIFHYFDQIITSDNSGYRKPQKEIFDYAMNSADASRVDSLFVGDNLDTDITGAQNAQMDHIFYNPAKKQHPFKVTYEIESLEEIMNIL
jgi:putative hydrolase of the HAD superfamily